MSNAALLDILSNGNDPPKIQPHLGSVFDGIGCLEFSPPDESVDLSVAADGAGDDPSLAESRKRLALDVNFCRLETAVGGIFHPSTLYATDTASAT